MGTPASEAGRFASEGPQRRVILAYPFAVGKYEVTVAEFAAFVAETNHQSRSGCYHSVGSAWALRPHLVWTDAGFDQTPSDPVVCVTWGDARAYAAWLGAKTGKSYRLLSEAEWEYAARGGETQRRPWGEALSREYANYGADECCGPAVEGRDRWMYTAPVGSFPANGFALHDMMGNVWEWVADCWNKSFNRAPRDDSPWETGNCKKRTVRGGSWFSDPVRVRSGMRYPFDHGVNRTKLGFRVARDL